VRVRLTIVLLLVACGVGAHAAGLQTASIIDRFLARTDAGFVEYRALRHLSAESGKFNKKAWMDVWTELDRNGFRFEIVAEGGSGYIRSKVFRAALLGEQKLWATGEPDKAALTRDNYLFEDRGLNEERLAILGIVPRRADVLLVHGAVYLNAEDADLIRIEGRLSKTPSFWTRRVEIVRHYRRINGVRVPVEIESVASMFVWGKSTFRMTYEYETINGQRVGSPRPASGAPAASAH